MLNLIARWNSLSTWDVFHVWQLGFISFLNAHKTAETLFGFRLVQIRVFFVVVVVCGGNSQKFQIKPISAPLNPQYYYKMCTNVGSANSLCKNIEYMHDEASSYNDIFHSFAFIQNVLWTSYRFCLRCMKVFCKILLVHALGESHTGQNSDRRAQRSYTPNPSSSCEMAVERKVQ